MYLPGFATYAGIYKKLDRTIALQVATATPLKKDDDEKDADYVKRIVACYVKLANDAGKWSH